MPPLAGPLVVLCCTRYPSKTRSDPSSIFTGNLTSNSRRTSRSTARRPPDRLRISAALSNCRCALSQGSSAGTEGAVAVAVALTQGDYQPGLDANRRSVYSPHGQDGG